MPLTRLKELENNSDDGLPVPITATGISKNRILDYRTKFIANIVQRNLILARLFCYL